VKCVTQTFIFLVVLFAMTTVADNYESSRQQMVATIAQHVAETADDIGKQQLDQRVMVSMAKVPRHEFVPAQLRGVAYRDRPLPIGYGQTISQPYIVALMTDLLHPQADHRILEVGTGSGYQAAVLSLLVKQVYSIEIVAPLAASAQQVLKQLAYSNVTVFTGNGYAGLPEQAPFDGIIVTAGGDIPPDLIEQLKPGGRLVIPVEEPGGMQYLTLIKKTAEGEVLAVKVLPVRFVPLIAE
jgi:protein-L-isoaspartate(D-aspartate) O-methyltransferase